MVSVPRLPRVVGPLIAAVLALSMAALDGPARAQAAAPMILLLPGGGWQSEDASSMVAYRDEFAASGYRTRIVVYPLGSVTASIEYADAVAQDERIGGAPVIAYGISAGGTIAAALAAEGHVEGAVDAIGPTDFTTWTSPVGILTMLALGMTEEEKHTASPYWRLNGQATPQLIQCGLLDPVTPYDQCHRYAAAATAYDPDTTLQATLNAHAQWPADRDRARAWVQARWPAPTLKSGREPEPEVQSTRSSPHGGDRRPWTHISATP
jgi:acetyl esterase/lipase